MEVIARRRSRWLYAVLLDIIDVGRQSQLVVGFIGRCNVVQVTHGSLYALLALLSIC